MTVSIAVMMAASAFAIFGVSEGADYDDGVLGASATVDITSKSVSSIQTEIQTAIGAAAAGDVVTVIGSKTNVDSPLALTSIPAVTVLWKAVYTKNDGYGGNGISLTGSGTFEVTSGAKILFEGAHSIMTSGSSVKVVVSGGEVINNRDYNGDGIYAGSAGVLVTGGLIRTNSGSSYAAIYSAGNITVTGGTIEAVGQDAVAIHARGSSLTITDGTVRADGRDSKAIYADNCDIAITGGLVQATGRDAYTIDVDGVVIAYLKGTLKGNIRAWNSAVFEVDRLDIPDDWNGTNNGVKLIKGDKFGKGDVEWNLRSDGMYFVISAGGPEFLWEGSGPFDEGSSLLLWAAIGVVAALIVVGVVVYFLKFRK